MNPRLRPKIECRANDATMAAVCMPLACRISASVVTSGLQVGESTAIPKETRHRLENADGGPLHIIEVQNGSYLGEDDIVRFQDDYDRAVTHEA